MPLTFPSHAALPLPLKLWRPRWFDGVALVTGLLAATAAARTESCATAAGPRDSAGGGGWIRRRGGGGCPG